MYHPHRSYTLSSGTSYLDLGCWRSSLVTVCADDRKLPSAVLLIINPPTTNLPANVGSAKRLTLRLTLRIHPPTDCRKKCILNISPDSRTLNLIRQFRNLILLDRPLIWNNMVPKNPDKVQSSPTLSKQIWKIRFFRQLSCK
jgi:hypothetical protein